MLCTKKHENIKRWRARKKKQLIDSGSYTPPGRPKLELTDEQRKERKREASRRFQERARIRKQQEKAAAELKRDTFEKLITFIRDNFKDDPAALDRLLKNYAEQQKEDTAKVPERTPQEYTDAADARSQ